MCLQELPDQYKELRKQGKIRRGGRAVTTEEGREEERIEESVSQGREVREPRDGVNAGVVEPPENYLCPITAEVMSDPAMAEDGYTYERAAITRWFEQKQTSSGTWSSQMQAPSPMGNYPVGTKLIPNNALRSEIMEWRQRNPEPVELID